MLFEPDVNFHILVKFGLLSGRLLGNSCSLDLRYVFLVKVTKCRFVLFRSVCGVGRFFLSVRNIS